MKHVTVTQGRAQRDPVTRQIIGPLMVMSME